MREFCSVNLANWLRERKVYFCLRLKKKSFYRGRRRYLARTTTGKIIPRSFSILPRSKSHKNSSFFSFNVACKWKRKILGVAPEEGWFIFTNLETLELAIAAYKRRFDLEEMFRDFKKGGYNLEDTNVSGDRLISLILLIAIALQGTALRAIAYTSATIEGQVIKRKGVQKYVGRVKEPGRIERRHSSFYIGLYGRDWVNFVKPYEDLVTKLMRLNRNKCLFYQRGLRAMELILAAS